jgi:hypothetical protein
MALRFLFCATFLSIGVVGTAFALRDDQPDDVWRRQNPPVTIEELKHAVGRSSRNPRLKAAVGRFYALDPDIQNFDLAERELRSAISAAPSDDRLWSALGETLSLAGKLNESETACRRAVELAPNHFDPLWQMANILFRRGKLSEAAPFARRAIALDEDSAPLMLDLGWQMTNGDKAFVASLVPDNPTVQLHYLKLLVAKKQPQEAVARWRTLAPEAQLQLSGTVREFVGQLIAEKEYAAAWEVWAGLPEVAQLKPVRGAVQDGGFQAKPIRNACFEWNYSGPQNGLQVRIDPAGPPDRGNALKIIYEAQGGAYEHARQLVLVSEGKYRLSYFTRSEDLVSGSPPVVEIRQPGMPQGFRARSTPSIIGTQQWKENILEFTVPAGIGVVEVVIVRPSECSGGGQCAIVGRAWFGGFKLEPVSGTASNRTQ